MDPLTRKIYTTNAAHFDERVCPGLRRTNDPIPDLRELFLLADDLPNADLPEQVGVEVGDVPPDPPAPVPPVAPQPPIVAALPQVDDDPPPEARPDQPPHQPQGRGRSRTPAGPPVPYVVPDRRYPERVRNPPGEWWKVKSPAPAPALAPPPVAPPARIEEVEDDDIPSRSLSLSPEPPTSGDDAPSDGDSDDPLHLAPGDPVDEDEQAAQFTLPFHSVLTAQLGDEVTLINALDFAFTIHAFKAGLASNDPKSFAEAMRRPDRNKWFDCAAQEIQSFIDNGTWELTKLPPGRKAVGSSWVFRIKRNPDQSKVGQCIAWQKRFLYFGANTFSA